MIDPKKCRNLTLNLWRGRSLENNSSEAVTLFVSIKYCSHVKVSASYPLGGVNFILFLEQKPAGNMLGDFSW